jgi:hypothetical protein
MNTTQNQVTYTLESGRKIKVNLADIFGAYGAKQVAIQACLKGHPNRQYILEQLNRSEASHRDARWKSKVREMILRFPESSETAAQYTERMRNFVTELMS